ncbi:MAG: hypothetical protein ACPLN0_00070 [Candidatus Hydrothermia bacterium]
MKNKIKEKSQKGGKKMRYITIIAMSVLIGVGAINAQVVSDTTQRPLRLRIHADSGAVVRDTLRLRVHERTMNQGDTMQIRVENQIQNRNNAQEMTVQHEVVKGEGTKTNIFKRIFTKRKTVTVQKEAGSMERNQNQVRDTARLRIRDENGDGIPDSLQIRERERLRVRDGSCQENRGVPSSGSGPNPMNSPAQRGRRGR